MAIAVTLTSQGPSSRERDVLAADLEALGADSTVLDLFGATCTAAGPLTRPRILRAHRDGALLGLTLVTLCRDSAASLFPQEAVRRAARTGPPMWYWERTGIGTDTIACPGIVAPGVDRERFADAAVSWLSARFAFGVLMERPGARTTAPHLVRPWLGTTCLTPDASTRPGLLAAHRNLERKVRRFGARGGHVERLRGAMPEALREPLRRGYAVPRPPDPPFRERYEAFVEAHWSLPTQDQVHLVARIGDAPVGYHSFLRTGRTLCLLSGVFDRPLGGTHHAYENVLLDSIDLALDLGCTRIEYGPAINAVKTSLLDVEACQMRFVSRVPGVLAGVRRVLPHTLLGPATTQPG